MPWTPRCSFRRLALDLKAVWKVDDTAARLGGVHDEGPDVLELVVAVRARPIAIDRGGEVVAAGRQPVVKTNPRNRRVARSELTAWPRCEIRMCDERDVAELVEKPDGELRVRGLGVEAHIHPHAAWLTLR